MSKYGSGDGGNRSIIGSVANRPQVSDKFRGLLGGPSLQVYKGNPSEFFKSLDNVNREEIANLRAVKYRDGRSGI